MRIFLVFAAIVALAGCTQTGISGTVHVGSGENGVAIVAFLLQVSDSGAIDLSNAVEISQLVVGTAGKSGGTFGYTFDVLTAGRYVVGAYADVHDDRQLTGDDPLTVNLDQPITIDPSSSKTASATQDIWIGMSAPARTTIRGTLHLSATAAASPVYVALLDRGMLVQGVAAIQEISVPAGSGSEVPFALYNVPASADCKYASAGSSLPNTPCSLHLIAQADVGNDDNSTTPNYANDLYALSTLNPITTKAGQEIQGADLWLGTQDPKLGSISGTATFNAPLSTLQLQLMVLTPDPTATAPVLSNASDVEAILNVPVASMMSANFTIPSLKLGTHFLVAAVDDSTAPSTLFAQRVYSTNNKDTPIALTADQKDQKGLEFPLGVGRVSGTVDVTGAPKTMSFAVVFALPPADFVPGGFTPDTQREAVVPMTLTNGSGSASYVVFGLEDNTYTMQLIPDVNGDGDLNDEYQAKQIFNGDPPTVTINGGGRQQSDFTVDIGSGG